MTKIIGLTGGIGSGKTTIAKQIQSLGIPVYIADEEAKKIIDLPQWDVDATWAGFYLQGTHSEVFTKQVDDVIHIINGIGGKGMTTSPGFTSEYIQKLYQK